MTELDGTPVRDAADLHIRLALLRTGEVAEFAVSRPGGTLTVRAEMAERPREKTEKTSVAEDMLSAAKSVFHAVLPK